MIKKMLLGASAISIVGIGAAIADTQRFPGLADRRSELPTFNTQLPSQPAQVQRPKVDDYKGTNKQLPPISTVVFNGPTVIDAETLDALTQPYLDRPITDNDVAALKNSITNEYIKRGYPLVKVATPTQDLRSGQLVINIYEGRIGQVLTQTNGVIASYIPEAFGARLNNSVFDEKEAEGVVNDLNEINNTTSSITLRPGSKPLTTDVVINTQQGGNQDVNYIAADNYGNELTGRYVGSLHLEKTNFFNHGEKLSFDGRISDEELYAAGGGIKIPTGVRNTFFEASYLYSHNDIVDRLEFLNAEGESHIMNFAFSGNVISEDNQKLTLRAGLDAREHKSFLNNVTDTKDHIRRPYVEATYLGLAPEYSTIGLANLRISKGVGILGGSEEGDAQLTRAVADPEAWIVNPALYVRHDLTPRDRVTFYGQGQLSTGTLLSSDTFILGGYGSVRGFEPAQEVGDAGYSFQAEYLHEFPITEETSVSVGPWIDGGHVFNRQRAQTQDNSLYAAGLGALVTANLLPTVGQTSLRLDWAHPLGDYNSPQVDDNSYYFRVQQNF